MRTIQLYLFILIMFFTIAATPLSAAEPHDNAETGTLENIVFGTTPQVFLLTEDEGLNLGVALNVSTSPYKRYDVSWVPLPMVMYEGEYVYLRGLQAGVKLLNRQYVELSVFAQYDDNSFDSHDTSHKTLRRLNNRYSTMDLGGEVRVLTPVGLLFTNIAFDVLGNNKGMHGTVGYAYAFEYGDFEFDPMFGFYWHNHQYNNYYYGVSKSRSQKSGVAAYSAGAGLSPYLGATLSYDLRDDLGIFCSTEVVFLDSTVKNSPMVGKSHTYSSTVGIMYGF